MDQGSRSSAELPWTTSSWRCLSCHRVGYSKRLLVDGRRCPTCNSEEIIDSGEVMQNPETGELSWGGILGSASGCDTCGDGLLPGVLFPWGSGCTTAHVERCDKCEIYASDGEAGEALIRKLGNGFELRHYDVEALEVLSSDYETLEEAGCPRLCVFVTGDSQPLTFESATRLVDSLLGRKSSVADEVDHNGEIGASEEIVIDDEKMDLPELIGRYRELHETVTQLRHVVRDFIAEADPTGYGRLLARLITELKMVK